MEFFSGLDVSMERTAICVVDDKGKVQLQTEVVTDPNAIAAALKPFLPRLRRAGHEAGSLSPWLQPELVKRGLPAVCLETKHVRAAMSAQRNKTDAADALRLTHIVRTGWFRQAHIKTASCYRLRPFLTRRRNLKRKVLDLENTIRHSLKAFGIRTKGTGRGGFDAAVREAVADDALTCDLMTPCWRRGDAVDATPTAARSGGDVRWAPQALSVLHGESEVGPVTALSFVTAIDDPSRFRRSRYVAAYFGLTSRRWQSGTSIDVQGRISKAGDPDVRWVLYKAASALMPRFKGREKVPTWDLALARRSCHHKVTVAVARKLAVIMHAMWTHGTSYVADAASVSDRAARAAREDGRLVGAQA